MSVSNVQLYERKHIAHLIQLPLIGLYFLPLDINRFRLLISGDEHVFPRRSIPLQLVEQKRTCLSLHQGASCGLSSVLTVTLC